jgi:ubiquinone biosynthesis protein UbiJ
MTANIEEYIHHELRTLPHASEVDYYCEQVTTVRLQADRLSARIQKLSQEKHQKEALSANQGANSDQP